MPTNLLENNRILRSGPAAPSASLPMGPSRESRIRVDLTPNRLREQLIALGGIVLGDRMDGRKPGRHSLRAAMSQCTITGRTAPILEDARISEVTHPAAARRNPSRTRSCAVVIRPTPGSGEWESERVAEVSGHPLRQTRNAEDLNLLRIVTILDSVKKTSSPGLPCSS